MWKGHQAAMRNKFNTSLSAGCKRHTPYTWKTTYSRFYLWEQVYNHMINCVGKMCVAAMSLCMIVLIVTRKRGDVRYYFVLWQTNTPNKLLLSESAKIVNVMYKFERMSKYILNEVETSHHLILIRLYFILTILITEDDHDHIFV
jgi:hypothetical protein